MNPTASNLLALLHRLAAAGSGMPSLRDLAEMMGTAHGGQIHGVLLVLQKAGRIEAIAPCAGKRRGTWRLLETGAVLDGGRPVLALTPLHGQATTPGAQRRLRRCLKGDHEFLSEHAGNRICDACARQPVFDGDASTYALAPPSFKSKRSVNRLTFA